MTQNVEHVLNAALSLSDDEQLQLASALMSAIDERGIRPFDDDWLVEIQRRSAEYDAGAAEVIERADLKASARRRPQADVYRRTAYWRNRE
jgi:putative addiction module component (TIGR02574 family)